MSEATRVRGRSRFIVVGFLMNLALGTIYSWSIFRTPLEESFGASSTESGLPYMLFLLFFALSMPLGGALIRKIGPRYTAMAGSSLVGMGWLLAGYSGSIALLALAYGVLGGIGVGLAYGVPLAVAGRWYSDRRGIALGLTLMGFGLSPLITAPLAAAVISAVSVLPAFRVMGTALFLFLLFLSLVMRYPDESEEASIPAPPAGAATAAVDRDTRAMLRNRQFYGLWTTYVIGALVGLTAIGITGSFAQQSVGLTAGQAAVSVSVFAICNGLGRPLFGYVTDRLGVVSAVLIAFGAIVLASGLLLLGGGESVLLFAISFAMFWMLLGGWLAIAPAGTTILFGPKHYPANYGVMYTAYGVGAVLGTLLSGQINELFGSYLYTFIPVIGLALLGMVIALLTLRRPAL
ncbi:MAG: OFA family MFS transporter [Alkalispirochaetaceae bacterium]